MTSLSEQLRALPSRMMELPLVKNGILIAVSLVFALNYKVLIFFVCPILHGLCSFGFSCKSLLDTYSNNDPTSLKKLSARFTSHVYPGETLIVEMWKEPNTNRVYFETKTKERNLMVMKGFAEFKEAPKL